jgi:hypothetical protein
MSQARADARRSFDLPLLTATVACFALAAILEAQVRSPMRLPGHRAFPGALVLVLGAGALRPRLLLPLGGAVGIAIGLLTGTPLLAVAWLAPATLLALAGGGTSWRAVLTAVAVGVLFGGLRYLAHPSPHRVPALVSLGGNLAFGTLGALVAAAIVATRRRALRAGDTLEFR